MFAKYVWLIPVFVGIYVLQPQNYMKYVKWNFVSGVFNVVDVVSSVLSQESIVLPEETDARQRVFTVNELKKYTDLENGLYLSILGQVYDVTKGAKHYGPGGSYHAFTGRDASLAFITGNFDEDGLTDDISTLSVQQIKALNDWVQFYNENYIYKGKLNGRYYNKDGSPTSESYKVQEKLIHAKEENAQEQHKKKLFPPCNIEWNAETGGTTVWCTKRSGGIERNWVGVPRMFFESVHSKTHRCACINLNAKEYKNMKGSFREYEGCAKNSPKCYIKHNTV